MTRYVKKPPQDILQLDAEQLTEIILDQSFPCSRSDSGAVYFLSLNGRVVYVGQSETMVGVWGRVLCHYRNKDFDHVCVWACDPSKLDDLEAFMIYTLKPDINSNFPDNNLILTKKKMKRKFGLNGIEVNKLIRKNKVELYMNGCRADKITITEVK